MWLREAIHPSRRMGIYRESGGGGDGEGGGRYMGRGS